MTINIEVKKNGLSQLQDGTWKLSLTIAPDEMPIELMTAPMGQRFGMALVSMDEQEDNAEYTTIFEHPADEKVETEGERLRTRAVLLCQDGEFQKFLDTQMPSAVAGYPSETECKLYIYRFCNIGSRAELATNLMAQKAFTQLLSQYDSWKYEQRYSDNLHRYE